MGILKKAKEALGEHGYWSKTDVNISVAGFGQDIPVSTPIENSKRTPIFPLYIFYIHDCMNLQSNLSYLNVP